MPVGEAAPEPASGQFVPKLRACQSRGYAGVRFPGRNGIREKRRLKTQAKINPCEISKQTAILVLLTTPKSVAPYSIDHIFHKQLYGIAITELTSLLSRRSVYCSKYPNSKYSITLFEDTSGNIRYKRTQHRWQNGKCVFCGASQSEYQRGDE